MNKQMYEPPKVKCVKCGKSYTRWTPRQVLCKECKLALKS